jgi:hypothetical protein
VSLSLLYHSAPSLPLLYSDTLPLLSSVTHPLLSSVTILLYDTLYPLSHCFSSDTHPILLSSVTYPLLCQDVECTFGIMKGRWRILKTGIRLQSRAIIDDVFFTCCVLHNMLMEYDGLHKEWSAGVNFDGIDGLHETEDLRRIFGRLHVNRKTDLSKVGHIPRPVIIQGDADHEEEDTECDDSFHSLNSALIEHFDVVSGENGIKWPRRNK